MDLLILLGSFVIILAGAELFTNGIEWFGRKLGLAEGAVGSVLAAVGTALPETMIPIIAILFSGRRTPTRSASGAILGAPFMLATLAMFVTGVAVMYQARIDERRRHAGRHEGARRRHADLRRSRTASRSRRACSCRPSRRGPSSSSRSAARRLRVVREGPLRGRPTIDVEDLAPLRFHRFDAVERLGRRRAAPADRELQVLVALGLIVVGAVAFVDAVGHVRRSLGVSQVLLALVVAPIATELPEKFNSIIWIRQGKDTLAMGNITGAMVFQSAIPTRSRCIFAPETGSPGRAATSRSRRRASPSSRARRSSCRCAAPAAARPRLLVGGAFYVAYLAHRR
jgi:cation:H+ antiporter